MAIDPLSEFLNSGRNRQWVEVVPKLKLYLRASGAVVTIANMGSDDPGKGLLTGYIDTFEEICRDHRYKVIEVENILNARLVPFFEKRGYATKGRKEILVQARKEL